MSLSFAVQNLLNSEQLVTVRWSNGTSCFWKSGNCIIYGRKEVVANDLLWLLTALTRKSRTKSLGNQWIVWLCAMSRSSCLVKGEQTVVMLDICHKPRVMGFLWYFGSKYAGKVDIIGIEVRKTKNSKCYILVPRSYFVMDNVVSYKFPVPSKDEMVK